MFYGTINQDASINTSFAFSNNFTVELKDGGGGNNSGLYLITFNEYFRNFPTIVATAYSNGIGPDAAVVEWEQYTYNNAVGQALITASLLGSTTTNRNVAFSFRASTGQSLVFDGSVNETVSLTPTIVSINGDKMLTVSTSLSGLDSATAQPARGGSYTAHLDKGSVLTGVMKGGGSMALEIPTTYTDPWGDTWALTGWTFGGGGQGAPVQWCSNGDTSTHSLELVRAGQGAPLPPMTAPQSFVIMATCGDQTLTTDPVVRLSSVAPGRISE